MEDRQRPKRSALMQEKERQRRSGRRPSLQASAAVAAASVEPSENANEQRERLRNVFQVCIEYVVLVLIFCFRGSVILI